MESSSPAAASVSPVAPPSAEPVTPRAEVWQGMYRTAVIPPELVERMRANSHGMRLLVLSEDWCSDCFSAVPLIARLAAAAGIDRIVDGAAACDETGTNESERRDRATVE